MPRESALHDDHAGVIQHRTALLAGTRGVDVTVGDVAIRISAVPLFREVDGALQQAVRLRLVPADRGGSVTASVRDTTGTKLDEWTGDVDASRTEFLFVPEVAGDTEVTVSLRCGDATVDVPFTLTPQRKWTVHLVHHSHYDIGYTDPQADVLAAQLAFIDDALELCAATDDWPVESRFRWTIEVNWPLRHWLRTRSREARDTLARRVREGRIEVNALPFSMHTEAYSYDELARQLEFAQELRETLGIEITTAMQTDVPGATVGLASLLTDAGIDFLAVAHNYAGRSIPHLLDGQELTRPFWWEAPDGEKLMVWYTDTLHGSAYMEAMGIGFGIGTEDVLMSLPEYLNAVAQRNYPYSNQEYRFSGSLTGIQPLRGGYPHDLLHLRVQGALGDNGPASILPATIAREWNDAYAWPRLVTSTNASFRRDALERLGDRLDTFRGDWTDWWADGIGSSAVVLAKNRESQAAIRTAQTLNALAVGLGDTANPDEPSEVRAAYEEMALFDEHTWGAANPWNKGHDNVDSGEHQWIRKASFAYAAEERVESLLHGGMERLGRLAAGSSAVAGEAIAVVNPSSWPRTDLVRVFIPRHAWPGDHVALVEADTGQSVPATVEPQQNVRHRPLGAWIRFLARDVPAFGYVRYRLSAGAEATAGAPDAGDDLRNDHLAVELDLARGAIGSLVDLRAGAELVNLDAPFAFNAYIHDRYTSGTRFNHLSSRMGRAEPWLLGDRGTGQYGVVTSRESNPVYQRVTWRQTGPGADWIETTLTLPHGVPRLQIANRLHKPAVMEKESVYFAYPFAGDDPRITFEITGGTAGPDSPHVPGSARHFRAIRHWATVETTGRPPVAWATTQAPLLQVGNIHLPYALFPASLPGDQERPGTIYSWALNNIWDTNFPPQQGGEVRFDYVVALGSEGDVESLGRDTGATASQPLVGLRARRGAAATDLPDRGSFVSVADPRVEVTHVANGADGELVVHLTSHAGERVTTRIDLSGIDIASAESANFLGANRSPLKVSGNGVTIDVAPGAIQTVILRPATSD